MNVTWDDTKNRSNYAKHGVTFEFAAQVFEDPLHLTVFDRVEDAEERWHAIGATHNALMLLVMHTSEIMMDRNIFALSLHERLRRKKGESMSSERMPTFEEQAEYLRNLPDDQIDTTDIPEVLDFSNAERGRFYRPLKRTVTLRLDADVLEWFKQHNSKYQTAINQVLREHVVSQH